MTNKIIGQTGRVPILICAADPPASPKQPPGCLGGPLRDPSALRGGLGPAWTGSPSFGFASHTRKFEKPPVHQVVQGTPLSPHDLSVVGAASNPPPPSWRFFMS